MKKTWLKAIPLGAAAAVLGAGLAGAAAPKSHTAMGEVKKIDSTAYTLTIKQKTGTKERDVMFHTTDQTSVMRDSQKINLADLKEGDRVKVSYTSEKGKLTASSITVGVVKAAAPTGGGGGMAAPGKKTP